MNIRKKAKNLHLFWAISGGAFTSLCTLQGSFYELILCVLLSMIIFGYYMPKLDEGMLKITEMRWHFKFLCALVAMTIAYYNVTLCYQSKNLYFLLNKIGMEWTYTVLFLFISTLSLPTFLVFALYGLSIMQEIIRKMFMKYKRFFFCAGVISIVVLYVYLFCTDIFFTGYNLIYSMDSSRYIETNVYINFTASENDIRQPFFGIASSLVFALPNLISIFVPGVYPYLIGIVDVFLIVIGNIFLIDMMGLKDNRELAFAFYIVLYPTIIFFFAVEQYAVPFFFTMLFLHQVYSGKRNEFVYALNTGTLIISGAWIPIMGIVKEKRRICFKKVCYCLFIVIGIAIVFGRFSLFTHSIDSIKELLRFSGMEARLTIEEQLKQYFNFVTNCFIKTGTTIVIVDEAERYVLNGEGYYWIIGLLIFLLCIVSFVINRGKYICRVSMYWLAIGFIVMAIIGYGTAENNLVLYSLYFGWPFAVLVFEVINKKLKVPIIRACAVVGVLCIVLYNVWTISCFLHKI